jgi:hypothetical protein
MMDDFERQVFEKQLKAALAKKEPSPFFEARVLGAAKRQAREHRASARMWWASGVAAALLVMTGSAWQYQRTMQEQAQEQAAGKQAKASLELALKITSVKLQKISQKVEGIQQN